MGQKKIDKTENRKQNKTKEEWIQMGVKVAGGRAAPGGGRGWGVDMPTSYILTID